MRSVCAWCGALLGGHDAPGPVSHGMCARCAVVFRTEVGERAGRVSVYHKPALSSLSGAELLRLLVEAARRR